MDQIVGVRTSGSDAVKMTFSKYLYVDSLPNRSIRCSLLLWDWNARQAIRSNLLTQLRIRKLSSKATVGIIIHHLPILSGIRPPSNILRKWTIRIYYYNYAIEIIRLHQFWILLLWECISEKQDRSLDEWRVQVPEVGLYQIHEQSTLPIPNPISQKEQVLVFSSRDVSIGLGKKCNYHKSIAL